MAALFEQAEGGNLQRPTDTFPSYIYFLCRQRADTVDERFKVSTSPKPLRVLSAILWLKKKFGKYFKKTKSTSFQ